MGTVVAFAPRSKVPSVAAFEALPPVVMLEALLFQCALLVDLFSPEATALYRERTGAIRAAPDAVHQWLFCDERENVELIPVLAGIARRTGRIGRAVYEEVMDELAELERQVRECA